VGVTGVSDQISIRPQANAGNIKSDIMVAVDRWWFTPGKMEMSKMGGKVTLTGTVDNWADRALAGSTAWVALGGTLVSTISRSIEQALRPFGRGAAIPRVQLARPWVWVAFTDIHKCRSTSRQTPASTSTVAASP